MSEAERNSSKKQDQSDKHPDGAMLDTNIFDQILDENFDLSALPLNLPLYVTDIQRGEIEKCPDLSRRQNLLRISKELPQKLIPTETFVLDVSLMDHDRLGDGVLYSKLQGGNPKNTKDALIAETCIKNNLILVTNDKALIKRVRRYDGRVMSLQEFCEI